MGYFLLLLFVGFFFCLFSFFHLDNHKLTWKIWSTDAFKFFQLLTPFLPEEFAIKDPVNASYPEGIFQLTK